MKRITLFCLLLLMPIFMMAQTQISGVVMAEGEPDPVIGANVMVKGTTVGTITDFDGNFLLDAKAGDMLVISYMGYKPLEVKATAAFMTVTLKPDNVMLDAQNKASDIMRQTNDDIIARKKELADMHFEISSYKSQMKNICARIDELLDKME
jgi:hypothetical protein